MDDTLAPLPARSKEERYYVSDEEAHAIERAARKRRISKSEYVRRLVLPRAARDAA